MIQLCGKEIVLPLQLIFKSMLDKDIFLGGLGKKSNVVPVHKKESKNLVKNYGAISKLSLVKSIVLSIFSKILERLVFKYLFNYFMQNKLFTECQSGFIHGCTVVINYT